MLAKLANQRYAELDEDIIQAEFVQRELLKRLIAKRWFQCDPEKVDSRDYVMASVHLDTTEHISEQRCLRNLCSNQEDENGIARQLPTLLGKR